MMKLIMLACGTDTFPNERPSWALLGGNDPQITNQVVHHFQDLWWREKTEDVELEWSCWATTVEGIAAKAFPGIDWNASSVYFFKVPSDARVTYSRDPWGNEIAYWFEGDEIHFPEKIDVEKVYLLSTTNK